MIARSSDKSPATTNVNYPLLAPLEERDENPSVVQASARERSAVAAAANGDPPEISWLLNIFMIFRGKSYHG
jgi:hypothetical protein